MTYMRSILIVDGDNAMRKTLREQLTRDDAFDVVEAASAREAEHRLSGHGAPFAAVIMDTILPDGDGHAVCARLRANGLSMPVILMNGANLNSANGADAADDTITIAKPFRLSELMARLHTRLAAGTTKGAAIRPAAPIRIGPYEFCPEDKSLRRDSENQRIKLTEKEAAILAFLHATGDRAVGRKELLREVWGYHPAVTTHTLETHIYRLRRKIEQDPAKACLLITEAGGYRLATG